MYLHKDLQSSWRSRKTLLKCPGEFFFPHDKYKFQNSSFRTALLYVIYYNIIYYILLAPAKQQWQNPNAQSTHKQIQIYLLPQTAPLAVVIWNAYLYKESWDQQDLIKGMNCKQYFTWLVSGIQQTFEVDFLFFVFKSKCMNTTVKNTNSKLKWKISEVTWYESTPWDEVFINNELSILPSSVGRKSTLNEVFPIAGMTYRDHKEGCSLSAVSENTHYSPTDISTHTAVSVGPTHGTSALKFHLPISLNSISTINTSKHPHTCGWLYNGAHNRMRLEVNLTLNSYFLSKLL